MPNRQVIGGEPYRYAYQGQEKDIETGKEAFQLRLWDSRIGRWLTTDPAGQYASPYLGMGNNPKNGVDPDGGKVIFPDKASALRAMKNLNALFKKEFGITIDAISIKDYNYKYHKNKGSGVELVFNKSEKFIKMLNDLGLSNEQKLILDSFKDILESRAEINASFAPSSDRAASANPSFWDILFGDGTELNESRVYTLKDTHGGTYNTNTIKINKELPNYFDMPSNFNIGSTILHELLWHISPMGKTWGKNIGDSNSLFKYLGIIHTNGAHENGPYQNKLLQERKFVPKGGN